MRNTAEGKMENAIRIVVAMSAAFVVVSVYLIGRVFGAW